MTQTRLFSTAFCWVLGGVVAGKIIGLSEQALIQGAVHVLLFSLWLSFTDAIEKKD
jgi:hypothetical protein